MTNDPFSRQIECNAVDRGGDCADEACEDKDSGSKEEGPESARRESANDQNVHYA